MDQLRKWMTILAMAGTILVTAVFCYMPFRELMKEYNKKTISLEEEAVIGDTTDEAETLYENMVETDTGESNKEENGGEEAYDLPKIVFKQIGENRDFTTTLWRNSDGICYVFLPGFAKDGKLQVEAIEDGGYMTVGSHALEAGDVLKNISFEAAYEFALYDKEENQIISAPLIFMHSAELPVVCVSTESESMELINESKENSETGTITVLDNQGSLLYEGEVEEIRGRGNSTFGLLKKPYQVKLKEKADLFGFGESRNYNLLADGYDETKLRNKIVLDMAKELQMPYTPDGISVDLYCNGEYYGIYFLCEKIEVGEDRVDIADMEANSSLVYSETETAKLTCESSEDGKRKWTSQEVEEADITGGYLFERELSDRYAQAVSGFTTDQGDAYALQSPKYATQNQVDYIADKMQEFQDAVEEKDGINKTTGKHYSEYIDVDSFVEKYLIEEVTKNYDGGVTSSFFYKPEDTVSTKIFAGPVWDYDVSFGNCNLDEIVSNPVGIMKMNDHVYGTDVFARLYEKEDFYAKVTSTYEERILPCLNRLLNGEIDNLAEEIRQSVRLDSIRFEELENRYQYYENYDNDIRYLKYFIEKRRDFLNEVWINGEVYRSVTFEINGEPWKKFYVKEGETPGQEPIPTGYGDLFIRWLSKEHDVPYDEFMPVYEDVTFYATWQKLPQEETGIPAADGQGENGN